MASLKMHKNEVMMVKIKEDKLVLERRIEQQAEEHAERANKLYLAEFRADLYRATNRLICKLREDVKAQSLRANNAEEHFQRVEHDLTHANSELPRKRKQRRVWPADENRGQPEPVTQHIREVGRRIGNQHLRKAEDKDEHTKLVYKLARRLHTDDHLLKGLIEEGKMNLLNFIARMFGRMGPQSPFTDQED